MSSKERVPQTMRRPPSGLTGKETIVADPRAVGRSGLPTPPSRPESASGASANKQAAILVIKEDGISSHIISSEACIASVGSHREECDIVIYDPEIGKRQMVVMNVGMHWLFMDCGIKDMVEFAGVKKRQQYVPLDYNDVMRVGDTYMVFLGVKGTYDSSTTVRLKSAIAAGIAIEDNVAEMVVTSGAGKEVKTNRRPLLIGAHESCDINVRDKGTKRFHAFLFWHPDGVFIETMGDHTIRLNGKDVSGTEQITEDSTFRLGNKEYKVTITGDVAAQCDALFPPESMKCENFALTALSDSEAGSFFLPGFGRSVTLGRSSTCDIVLNDSGVSREHAQMIPNGKTISLIDNYSANGTFVNGERVNKTRVRAGDIIEVGNSFFLVHYT